MKTKTEIDERLERFRGFKDLSDDGSEAQLVLISAIDELEWVLREW